MEHTGRSRSGGEEGFDCTGCVWPEPDPTHRHRNEYVRTAARGLVQRRTVTPARFVRLYGAHGCDQR
ncbi:hypothetical protein ACFU6I_13185 [Streptomyces sp. NPDC057486]|uniref:hypothetical protein n=1 Tax=Streptomyces sp. NPDC057486 TaxID=3346145 RepID=UPI003697B549